MDHEDGTRRGDAIRRLEAMEDRAARRADAEDVRERFAAWVEGFPIAFRRVRVGGTDKCPVYQVLPDAEATLRALADAIRHGDLPAG
jgi:hypothetical protein